MKFKTHSECINYLYDCLNHPNFIKNHTRSDMLYILKWLYPNNIFTKSMTKTRMYKHIKFWIELHGTYFNWRTREGRMRGMSNKMIEDSKYLSYLLRHHPEEAGCDIDNHGWLDVETLIKNTKFTLEDLKQIVKKDTRYEFSEDKSKIRAFHGHSIPGIICEEEVIPPDVLYHGTSINNKLKIFQSKFIKKQNRTWVHLSENLKDARRIGKRHGEPVVLFIDAKKMHEDGIKFYKTRDGVYLTDDISIKYIKGVDYC